MLSKIIDFSVKNKLFIGSFILLWILIGIYQASKLPIDAVPDITNNQVQIITTAPSLGAEDVERLITFPLEQLISNVPHQKEIRSMSRFGLSILTVVFDDKVDVYWARQQISERLSQLDYDSRLGSSEMAPITTGLGEIYQYVLEPKKGFEKQFSLEELRSIQDWIIRRQLLGTKGVADISTFGGKLKQYEVAVDPVLLKASNVSLSELYDALAKNNENTGGAYIEREKSVLYIRTSGLINSLSDIENTIVSYSDKRLPILVKDLGKVKIGSAIRYGALTSGEIGEVTGGIVMMLKGANSSEVIENVKSRIKEIQKTLPDGLEIKPFLDRTKMVNNAISTVKTNLLEGALIVIFVLIMFLGNIRAGIIVASVIPLSLLFAISMMQLFGVSGNLMSLGALDFGLIVDGAVIIVEAVLHVLYSRIYTNGHRLSKDEMNTQVSHSASKMMNAAVFGQIIILIVYLPILSLQGIEGKMFKPMAQTVAFAIIGAFILSLTYVPMITSLLLKRTILLKKTFADKLMDKIESAFLKIYLLLQRTKRIFIIVISILFISCIWIFSRMGGEFIPQLEEGDFAVETRLLVGTNLQTTIETFDGISKLLKNRFEEVEQIVSRIGAAEIPTDPMPIEGGDLIIVLKPKKQWKNAQSYSELADKMQKAVQSAYLGVTMSFQFPVQMRFNELMTGSKQDVVIKVFGEDLEKLTSYSEQIGEIVTKIKGTTDLYIEKMVGMPQMIVNYKRSEMARYGVSIENVNQTINAAFAGGIAGIVYEGEKRFDLVVRLKEDSRKEQDVLQNLIITTSQGAHIPLRNVADIQEVTGPNQIQREQTKRRIMVGFNIRGRDVESVVNDIQKAIDKELYFDSGYTVSYGGTFENLQEAKSRLVIAVPISLLLIFILLYAAFKNLKDGLLIFTAIPLSSIGGILALALRDLPFSISAGVGFIALFGVAVLNGIVLITEFNKLKEQHPEWDISKVVLEGTKTRLRPVLMTACVASLGFIPMALSNGAGAEVQRPLATVVIGGLISATFLTLFLLPILYPMFHSFKKIPKSGVVTSLILLFISANYSFSQTPLNLDQATAIMLENNRQIKMNQMTYQNMNHLKKGAFDFEKTDIGVGWGQYNSEKNDISFSIGQRFAFPTFYSNSAKAISAEMDIDQKVIRQNLLYLLRKVHFQYQVVEQKKKLLNYTDSLLQLFAERSKKRYETGEISLMEKTTAETQREELSVQLSLIQQDEAILIEQYHYLLQSDSNFIPQIETEKLSLPKGLVITEEVIQQLPVYQRIINQIEAKKWHLRVQRAALLPDFYFSYNNQSMTGTYTINNQDIFYGRSKRFHAFEAGLSIPIIIGPTLKRLKFNQLQIDVQQVQLDATMLEYKMEMESVRQRIKQAVQQLDFYENTALKNSIIILNEANQKSKLGEIDFFQWLIMIQQVIRIQNDYLDALSNYNDQIIQFKKLYNE
ncbi:MAG: CusA/CzcA family heavy metal efflux RND transporter [Flavobacteriia bacterium]|nr:CusA/CzcA family heavy metal efflux RND transporter [Flavobacteriia bacterium]